MVVIDVLVVGGGPVGLLAATELAYRGCNVRIIDLNESPVLLVRCFLTLWILTLIERVLSFFFFM